MFALSAVFLAIALAYSLLVSWLAYRESGRAWMLFLPHWIDANSGVSTSLRRHGMLAFGMLFAATLLFFAQVG